MQGVLNVTTSTVHKQKPTQSEFDTQCGATTFVPDDRLEVTSLEAKVGEPEVRRCGRCFDEAGGY